MSRSLPNPLHLWPQYDWNRGAQGLQIWRTHRQNFSLGGIWWPDPTLLEIASSPGFWVAASPEPPPGSLVLRLPFSSSLETLCSPRASRVAPNLWQPLLYLQPKPYSWTSYLHIYAWPRGNPEPSLSGSGQHSPKKQDAHQEERGWREPGRSKVTEPEGEKCREPMADWPVCPFVLSCESLLLIWD